MARDPVLLVLFIGAEVAQAASSRAVVVVEVNWDASEGTSNAIPTYLDQVVACSITTATRSFDLTDC